MMCFDRQECAELVRRLTPRQRQVLDRIADGEMNKTIADELRISEHGVVYHVRRIYNLLGVHSRVEAARVSLEGRK